MVKIEDNFSVISEFTALKFTLWHEGNYTEWVRDVSPQISIKKKDQNSCAVDLNLFERWLATSPIIRIDMAFRIDLLRILQS